MRLLIITLLLVACQSSVDDAATIELGQYDPTLVIDETFALRRAGDDLTVEVGGQGALMAVVGVRVKRAIGEDTILTVEAALRKPNGDAWARPKLRVRPHESPDGWVYLAGLFLIVSNDPFDRSWENTAATLEVSVTETGSAVPPQQISFPVRLVPSTGPMAPPSLIPDAGPAQDTRVDTRTRADVAAETTATWPDVVMSDLILPEPDAPTSQRD